MSFTLIDFNVRKQTGLRVSIEVWFEIAEHDSYRRNVWVPYSTMCNEDTGFDDKDTRFDFTAAAEVCAERYFHIGGGYESDWPLTFTLWTRAKDDESAKCCGSFEVDRRFIPCFTAEVKR